MKGIIFRGRQRKKELITVGGNLRGINQSRFHITGDKIIVFLK